MIMITKLFILSLAITGLRYNAPKPKEYVDNLKDYPAILSVDNFMTRLNDASNPIQNVLFTFGDYYDWDFVDFRSSTTTTYHSDGFLIDNTNRSQDIKVIDLHDRGHNYFTISRSTGIHTLFDLSGINYQANIRYLTTATTFANVDFTLKQASVGRMVNITHATKYANAYNSAYNDNFFNMGNSGTHYLFKGYVKTEYQYFNDISFTYIPAVATRYYDGSLKVIDNNLYCYPSMMRYHENYTGNSRIVANANTIRKTIDGQEQFVYAGGMTWNNLEDTNIFVYTYNTLFHSQLTQLTNTTALQNLLWSPSNINTLEGSTGSSGSILNNTFTLFKSAFDSVSNFFSMQIFPGISVGLLVFIPFISGLLVILVRIFKK